MKLRLSLCNEVLAPEPFARQCELACAMGYDALEVAPFTLANDPQTLDATHARRLTETAKAHGLAISSLHWLLVKPEGLSLVTADGDVRERTLDLLRRLIDFAHECGATALVHGSPKQRSPQGSQTPADALARLEDALAELAPHADAAGVTYCLEPLSPVETSVVNTVAQAAAVVDRIGSPALRTMFDLSAASQAETEPVHEVLARFLASGHVAHVQLNDRNRRGPGQGQTDLRPVLKVLRDHDYAGWTAIEPFEYAPDGPGCAAFSAGYVRGMWTALS
ncbi:sugar phosphate isomerase/epimerase family protein [Variovorax dokdonensis]|uniref:Sugar phosphate isomerase/epimerase family protein n=1 Tax=Variovorax dokdonensis TaxID=344883 RepID=A0ABT7N7M9_9BURK|nr:sugar phosphate isomerase/epimerase family protein [Variovorax dokdonensis]MDM0043926.1 sugar phosphate isomerase/epimerase family protein [Variovorax dokdonensis]